MKWVDAARVLRHSMRHLWAWSLLVVAAVVTALLSVLGRVYTGVAAGVLVAVAGVVAGVMADRGRARLVAAPGPSAALGGPYVERADRAEALRLGVHRAEVVVLADGGRSAIPPFVPRDRLPELEAALGAGGFLLVSGDSTAGKTRLAFEAVRRACPDHVVVDPDGPDGLVAAVEVARERRPSVLWLDDLERYLGVGGLTPAHVAELSSVSGIVIVATMRAHERESFRYDQSGPSAERHLARTGRQVLACVTTEVRLERLWSQTELALARDVRDDPRIASALDSADRHGVAEHVAAGPDLLEALADAWAVGHRSRGAALVTAAVDVRRAGYHRPVPLTLLRDLHEHYLRERGGSALRPGPWDDAVDWVTRPRHGASSMLEPVGAGYLAFDYLVDAAARDPQSRPIPDATWRAVLNHADPNDCPEIVWQASFAGRFEDARPAFDRVMAAGAYLAAAEIAACVDDSGREPEAAEMLESVIAAAQAAGTPATDVLSMRRRLAWTLGEKASGHGDPQRALGVIGDVVRDSTALLGGAHPDTLAALVTMARQTGATGDPATALEIATRTAALTGEHLGTDNDLHLSARFEVAVWTASIDGDAAGAEAFRMLLAHAESLDSVSWGLIIDCLWNLAGCLLGAGDPAGALEAAGWTVDEAALAYGPSHYRTLMCRLTFVDAVGAAGDPQRAAELANDLAADCLRVLGADHPTTRKAEEALASWRGAAEPSEG